MILGNKNETESDCKSEEISPEEFENGKSPELKFPDLTKICEEVACLFLLNSILLISRK